jgi:single-strand DNA-binding protein
MSSRSLNKVILIGNLTRDPELRYTPTGAAVCTIGLATNRTWVTDNGEKKEEVEFHRVVAWNKLAELCSQLLAKGRKVYVEGRLRTSSWQAQDGSQRTTTEIVIDDMILLDSKRPASPELQRGEPVVQGDQNVSDTQPVVPVENDVHVQPKVEQVTHVKEVKKDVPAATEDVNPDDIPF